MIGCLAVVSRDAARAAGNESLDEGKLAPSDAELIERCLGKDNAAWELVVARYRRKVFHIAYKFTGKHDEAEDLQPGDLPEGLPQPRQVQPRRRLLDLALERGAQLLHRPLPGQQAREGGPGRGRCSPSTSPPPPRATRTGRSRTRTGAASCAAGSTSCPGKLREAVVLRDLQGLSYQEMARAAGAARGHRQEPDQPGPRGARAAAAARAAAGAAGGRRTRRRGGGR